MLITAGTFAFEWIEGFADIPDPEAAAVGWAHHDVALAGNGNLLTSHPSRPTLLELTRDGSIVGVVDLPLTELHGITVCPDGRLWLADIGRKRLPEAGYGYVDGGKGGRVVRLAPSGHVDMEIEAPDLSVYRSQAFSPTKVAVGSEQGGGSGDIWVADGYGQNLVHRFSSAGEYLATISGEEGPAGRFKTPHAIWLDHRRSEAELYIADRANNRIQVYDLDGAFKRCFGDDFLVTPSAFAALGDHLLVAELSGRLTILDRDDRPVATIGSNLDVAAEPGWPNALDGNARPMRSDRIRPGAFNSPHGLATDGDGNIYVSEWLIGGRYIKLSRA